VHVYPQWQRLSFVSDYVCIHVCACVYMCVYVCICVYMCVVFFWGGDVPTVAELVCAMSKQKRFADFFCMWVGGGGSEGGGVYQQWGNRFYVWA